MNINSYIYNHDEESISGNFSLMDDTPLIGDNSFYLYEFYEQDFKQTISTPIESLHNLNSTGAKFDISNSNISGVFLSSEPFNIINEEGNYNEFTNADDYLLLSIQDHIAYIKPNLNIEDETFLYLFSNNSKLIVPIEYHLYRDNYMYTYLNIKEEGEINIDYSSNIDVSIYEINKKYRNLMGKISNTSIDYQFKPGLFQIIIEGNFTSNSYPTISFSKEIAVSPYLNIPSEFTDLNALQESDTLNCYSYYDNTYTIKNQLQYKTIIDGEEKTIGKGSLINIVESGIIKTKKKVDVSDNYNIYLTLLSNDRYQTPLFKEFKEKL